MFAESRIGLALDKGGMFAESRRDLALGKVGLQVWASRSYPTRPRHKGYPTATGLRSLLPAATVPALTAARRHRPARAVQPPQNARPAIRPPQQASPGRAPLAGHARGQI